MIAEIIGVFTLIVCIISLLAMWNRTNELGFRMQAEGEMAKENLNHIAAALVGLSELLGDAEEIVSEAQQIPSLGEMLQQMVSSMLISKLSPSMQPFAEQVAPLISDSIIPPSYAEAEIPETENAQVDSVQHQTGSHRAGDSPDSQ